MADWTQGVRVWLAVALVAFCAACDLRIAWSDHPYYVYALDGGDWQLGRRTDARDESYHGRVGPTLVAVGADDRYVVAERLRAQTGRAAFYVIDRSADRAGLNADEIVEGPFDQAEFMRLKTALGLPDFDWQAAR